MKIGPLHITAYGSTGKVLKEKLVLRNIDGQAFVSVQLCERKKGPPTATQQARGQYLAELVSCAETLVGALETLASAASTLPEDVKVTITQTLAPVRAARARWEALNGSKKSEGTNEE